MSDVVTTWLAVITAGYMNDQQNKEYGDSLKEFHDLKARFDQLRVELQEVHNEWLEAHKNPPAKYMERLTELVTRETQLYDEINKVNQLWYSMMVDKLGPSQ